MAFYLAVSVPESAGAGWRAAASSARERMSSLANAWVRCVSTVRGVTYSRSAMARLPDTRVMEHLAERLAEIPGVVAVTLGGSRATGTAVEGSDWDFGLYYRGGLDPADITALGWPGRVFAPGEWGTIVNGGAWLTVDGAKVDLIYRDLDEVLRWTAAAGDGRFEIRREVGYVAGIATYILAGELALGRVLAGDLPRPAFPPRLLQTAPDAWFRLAAGALSFAGVYADRQDRVACLANLCQAVLATGQGRLAAAGQWVLNEKRLTERAGLDAIQDRLAQPGPGLDALVSDVRARLSLDDPVWAVRPAD
jgi:Nucleotidyltransferase domain